MSNPISIKQGLVTAALLATAAIMGVCGVYLYQTAKEDRWLQAPPPPRIDAAMIKGAWINVVPREDAAVAISMGRCLDRLNAVADRTEKALQKSTRHCESEALILPRNNDLAQRATSRRQLLTSKWWVGEPEHEIFKFSHAKEINTLWMALAQNAQEREVAKFLQQCLGTKTRKSTGQLHMDASTCETRSTLATWLDLDSRDALVFGRNKATRQVWLGHPPEVAPRPTAADTSPAAAVSSDQQEIQQPAIPDQGAVVNSFMRTTDATELLIALQMKQCLEGMGGLVGDALVICQLRMMSADNSGAVDRIIARLAKDFPGLPTAGKRYSPSEEAAEAPVADEPAIETASEIAAAATGDTTTKSSTARQATIAAADIPGAADIISKWNNKSANTAEKAVGERLTSCLKTTVAMTGDHRGLQLAVDTCKLQVQLQIEQENNAAKILLD